MRHPYHRLSPAGRLRLFLLLLVLTLALLAAMGLIHDPLAEGEAGRVAPWGMISLQLTHEVDAARAILDAWRGPLRDRALFGLGFDYLFMAVYPWFLSLGCALLAERTGGRTGRLGIVLAWLLPLAWPLDALENLALWRLFADGASPAGVGLIYACALPKWLLVAVAAAYLAGAGLRLGLRRGR